MSRHAPPGEPPRRAWRILALAERLMALALGLLLLRSAFIHLGNPYLFLSTVYSYQLTDIELGKWVAVLLPALQVVLAICLLTRWWLVEAYLLAAALFLGFVAAQSLALRQGLKISCGCFGAGESLRVGPASLTLAGALAAVAVLGCLVAWRRRPASPVEGPTCELTPAGPA